MLLENAIFFLLCPQEVDSGLQLSVVDKNERFGLLESASDESREPSTAVGIAFSESAVGGVVALISKLSLIT